MCRKVLLSLFFGAVLAVFCQTASAKDVSCSKRQRELQDCKLKLGPYPVHIWKDKIILRGPVEREMASMKLAGFTEWDAIQGIELGGRHFLEVILWGTPTGEGEVSTAMSYLYELKRGEILKRVERAVQKRKQKVGGDFEYDKRVPVKLKLQSGKVLWSSGKESGVL